MKQKKILSNIFVYLTIFASIILFSATNVYAAQSSVNLGTAGNYIILAKSGISTTGTTSIVGDIGVSPISSTAITGFGLIMNPSNQFSTSSKVTGKIYAANYRSPTPTVLTTAISDMQKAYTNAAGRTNPTATELGAGNIGGKTFSPGLYKWSSGVTIPTDVTLLGGANDVWIFQIAGTLDVSNGKKVMLKGGAQAKNIFWVVAGQTTLGTTSVFNGNILGKTAIVLKTGATLNGKALAQTAVTLDANSISSHIKPITDTIPPVITILGTNPVNIIQKTIYTDAGATARDNVNGIVTVSSFGIVNTAIIGTYIITYKAKDTAGNVATAIRTVKVVAAKDTIPPVITILGTNPVNIIQKTIYTDAGATARDNVNGVVKVSSSGTVNTAIIGTYLITYKAKDVVGNTATAKRTVKVLAAPITAQSSVNLGTAGNYIILAKSGISTTGTTSIVGDIGVSPISSTAITGFGLIMNPSNQFSTSSKVTGKIYAANYRSPTPTVLTTAISDMQKAYTNAAGRTNPTATELGAGNIGGKTFSPGLYKWSSGVTIPTDVTLLGGANDVWIFQIAGTLDVSNGKKVMLKGGAQAKNIFWVVAGQTTLGTTSVFNGNILGKTAIVLKNGATLNGRALAQTAVTLDSNKCNKV